MSYMSMWLGPPSSQIRMTEVFLVALPVRRPTRLGAEQLRQAEAGHAGDAELQEAAAAEAVAIARSVAEVDSEHGSEPPWASVGVGRRGGRRERSAVTGDRSP